MKMRWELGGGNVPIVVIGDDDRIFTESGNESARDRVAGGSIPNLKGGGRYQEY